MAQIEILLPAMGEGIIEATITKWLVKEGTMVEEDDPILEVATDKVDTEIPAPASGILSGFAFSEGDIPKVGEILAYITREGSEEVSDDLKKKIDTQYLDIKEATSLIVEEKQSISEAASILHSRTPGGKYLSPLVRKIAQEENISYSDLDDMDGTGMDGRITRDDIIKKVKAM